MTQADSVWYRLELLTTASESVASALWGHGALGVEVQDRHTYMEDGSISPVPDGTARLIAFFHAPFDTTRLSDDVEVVSNNRFDDVSWKTAWMEHFKPLRLSARSIVGPPWEEFEAPEGGVKVEIEPGMAFGTGTHETTGVCATLLDELIAAHAPKNVLDVGCGTGVLSMIAAGLGVERVAGVDNDPIAVDVATENLRRNGMQDRVHVSKTPLPRLGVYDLVVANILAHILLDLGPDLVARVGPSGHLVTSGITVDQADSFAADFADPELELIERRDRGEWAAFVWRRTS